MKCRKFIDDVQNRGCSYRGINSDGTCLRRSGVRHERWPELAMRRLNGTWEPEIPMLMETSCSTFATALGFKQRKKDQPGILVCSRIRKGCFGAESSRNKIQLSL